MTEKANPDQARAIAIIHSENIAKGFLATLGISFLSSLYKYLIKNELVIVYKDGDNITGFVSYSFDSAGIIKRFICSRPFVLFKILLSLIIKPSLIKSVFETIKAPQKSNSLEMPDEKSPDGELLSISVDRKCQKAGTGTVLLNALEEALRNYGVKSYKVVAGNSLIGANKFYQKNGFVLAKKIIIHGNSLSNVYVKCI